MPDDHLHEDEYYAIDKLSLCEIINGKSGSFSGLIVVVKAYVDLIDCDSESRQKIFEYLDYVRGIAVGMFHPVL